MIGQESFAETDWQIQTPDRWTLEHEKPADSPSQTNRPHPDNGPSAVDIRQLSPFLQRCSRANSKGMSEPKPDLLMSGSYEIFEGNIMKAFFKANPEGIAFSAQEYFQLEIESFPCLVRGPRL